LAVEELAAVDAAVEDEDEAEDEGPVFVAEEEETAEDKRVGRSRMFVIRSAFLASNSVFRLATSVSLLPSALFRYFSAKAAALESTFGKAFVRI
jgi:hypothetical protein